ncbi:hypothetical protein DdX_15859 [Ditylenchus destructor]|uniref:Uncharacterized protein n=1 Tax=Ditylenchus destructor TaxID=166010 RepID=A0AAD4MPM3_9BILA|nr:hypothetical protein DdX_15859 [Ditylenchus destructor]
MTVGHIESAGPQPPQAKGSTAGGFTVRDKSPIRQVNANRRTSEGTAESGLSPWIVVGIILVVLLLVAGGAGLLVFLICRRKRREPAQNMAEKGNAGIDCQCETAVSSSVVLQTAVSGEKPVSAKVNEPPKNERKDERSKPTSQTEVAKPVSQKKQNVPEQRAKTAKDDPDRQHTSDLSAITESSE